MGLFSYFSKNKDNYSQSGQDQFAYNLIGDYGTYLEIGAHDPIINSNTYKLETLCGWSGFSVEYDRSHQVAWNKCKERNMNRVIWDDAFNVNYLDSITKFGLSNNIDYLSCDIEPPNNTFEILKLLINLKIEFKFISYEHDKYASGEKFENQAKNFLSLNGYKIAVDNVYSRNKKHKIYETWFVKKNINLNPISYENWKKTNYFKNNFVKQ